MKLLLALTVVLVASIGSTARTQVLPDDDDGIAARIRAISRRMEYPADLRPVPQRYYDELPAITAQLQSEVDAFIQRAVRVNEDSTRVQARLRKILAAHVTETGTAPFATSGSLQYGRSLVISYSLVRPPHFNLGTIRAYRVNGDAYELATTAGNEFSDYNMFVAQLNSPIPGEIWLLVWGRNHTANGNQQRFRLFAFDGDRFRTVWAPEDLWDASLRVVPNGFVIDRTFREPPYRTRAEYRLTLNGPIQTN